MDTKIVKHTNEYIYHEILYLLESKYSQFNNFNIFPVYRKNLLEIDIMLVKDTIIKLAIIYKNLKIRAMIPLTLKLGYLNQYEESRKRKLNKIKRILSNMDRIVKIIEKAQLFDDFLGGIGIFEIHESNRLIEIVCSSRIKIIGPYENRNIDFTFIFLYLHEVKNIKISFNDMINIEKQEQFFDFIGILN